MIFVEDCPCAPFRPKRYFIKTNGNEDAIEALQRDLTDVYRNVEPKYHYYYLENMMLESAAKELVRNDPNRYEILPEKFKYEKRRDLLFMADARLMIQAKLDSMSDLDRFVTYLGAEPPRQYVAYGHGKRKIYFQYNGNEEQLFLLQSDLQTFNCKCLDLEQIINAEDIVDSFKGIIVDKKLRYSAYLMDLVNERWREFLVENLHEEGIRNFFV